MEKIILKKRAILVCILTVLCVGQASFAQKNPQPVSSGMSGGSNGERARRGKVGEEGGKNPDSIEWVHSLPRPSTGISYETFKSSSMNKEVGYCIYLPPGYEAGITRYPVVYWLHGIGGNEAQSSKNSSYLHQLIAANKVEPAIMVFVNGAIWSMYLDSPDGKVLVETSIIKELIPHIDKTYRTTASKKGRSIEGFSMGGFGSLRLAFKYPQLFSSVVVYGPAVLNKGGIAAYHPDIFQIMLGGVKERLAEEEPTGLLSKHLDIIKNSLKIRIVVGNEDIVYAGAKGFHELLVEKSIPHEYEELPGVKHAVGPYYERVAEKGYRFHEEARRNTSP